MMFKVWLSKLKTPEAKQNNSLQTLPGSPLWRGPVFPPSPLFWGRFTSIVFLRLKNWGISTLPSSSLCCKTIKDLLQWGLTWETNCHLSTMKGMRCEQPHLVDIWFRYTSIIHTRFIYRTTSPTPNFRESIKILYSRTSVEVTYRWGIQNAVQRHTEKSLKQKRAFSWGGDLKLKPWIPLDTWKSLKICLRCHRFGKIIVVDRVHDQRKKRCDCPKKTSYCSSTKILHQLILPLNSFEM